MAWVVQWFRLALSKESFLLQETSIISRNLQFVVVVVVVRACVFVCVEGVLQNLKLLGFRINMSSAYRHSTAIQFEGSASPVT
jgi:hypothetical protein